MTAATDSVAELVARLGCAAVTCPDRAVQSAELRQRQVFTDWPEWWDGYAETGPAPHIPMLILRYAGGVNVATFHERPDRPRPDVWLRFAVAFFPLGACASTIDLQDEHELHIAGETYRGAFALVDTTDCDLLVERHRVQQMAALTAHLPDLSRTVVVIGPPDLLDGLRLDWHSPPR